MLSEGKPWRHAGIPLIILVLLVLSSSTHFASPAAATSPPSPPSLGTAIGFGVLAGSAVTNAGASVVFGSLGVSPSIAVTGFPPGMVTGATHKNDGVAAQAKSDLATAYNAIAGDSCTNNLTGQNLGGLTLTPGVYCFSSAALLTGKLTLNAQGENNAVFIFKIGSALTTASSSSVTMTAGSDACNVFWQIGSSAVLGTETAFEGNVLALASITLGTGANITGAALARNGAVTLGANHILAYPTSCDAAIVESNIKAAGEPYVLNDAINLAIGSSEFKHATTGFATSFTGANDGWSFNSILGVSWTGVAVDFLMAGANGSRYSLSISENPKTGVVYSANVMPVASAQVYVGYGTSYSGYGISGAPPTSNQQVYASLAEFYQPTVSKPSVTPPTCDVYFTPFGSCNLTVWAGLATYPPYTGPHSASSGGVVQAGTLGIIRYNSNPDITTTVYAGFTEDFESSNPNNGINPCLESDVVSPSNGGDAMEAELENQLAASGTSGSLYYTYVFDYTASWVCSAQYTDSFFPIYADFIAERPQNGTMSNGTATDYSLPAFSTFYFWNCAMYVSSYVGVYSNYNNGYGFGVQMLNKGYQETSTPAMTQYPTGFGEFTEGWDTSLGS